MAQAGVSRADLLRAAALAGDDDGAMRRLASRLQFVGPDPVLRLLTVTQQVEPELLVATATKSAPPPVSRIFSILR